MILNPLDAPTLRDRFLRGEPFPHVVIDNFLDPHKAHEAFEQYPVFDDAVRAGRGFANLHERAKAQVSDSSRFPEKVSAIHEALAAPEFLEQLSEITDIPDLIADPSMCGGGMHIHEAGGALDVHVDFNMLVESELYRRLNLIVYLTPDWQDEWEGCFELWDPAVKRCFHRVSPQFNRCMIFRTSETSFHGVGATRTPPGVMRRSFSAFYYTATPPPWSTGAAHDTIYRARPSEHLKRHLQMPLLAARNKFRARRHAAKQQIKSWLLRDA